MLSLNNVAVGDTYTQFTERQQPGTVRFNLYVYNAPVYFQWMDENMIWSEEVYLPQGERSYDRSVRGVRVRNAVAGKVARVTLELLAHWDIVPGWRGTR